MLTAEGSAGYFMFLYASGENISLTHGVSLNCTCSTFIYQITVA